MTAVTAPETPAQAPTPPRRHLRRILAAMLLLLIAAALTIFLVIRSPWFADKVKHRIITEVETASGGRAELTAFHFDWRTLTASVTGFILHGKEPAGEAPLLVIDGLHVGIGVTSFRSGAHVRYIEADHPMLHILATEDGTTNLPTPAVKRSDNDFIDTLLDLAAGELIVRDGLFVLNEHRIPINLRAENTNVHLNYNRNRNKPLYFGDASVQSLNVDAPPLGALDFGFESSVVLEHGDVRVSKARLFTKQSQININGFAYHLLNPSMEFGVDGTLALSEMVKPLRIPLEPTGQAHFTGDFKLALKEHFSYDISGQLKATGLALHQGSVSVNGIALESSVRLDPVEVDFTHLVARALDGSFTGSGNLKHYEQLTIDGTANDFATDSLLAAVGRRPAPYSAKVTGPVHLETRITSKGPGQTILRSQLALTPNSTVDPMTGLLNFTWDQHLDTIELNESYVSTPTTEVDLGGTIGKHLEVKAHTSRLEDLQAILTGPLPVKFLAGGAISFAGSVDGPLEKPHIDGRATAAKIVYEDQTLDQASADIALSQSNLEVRSFHAVQGSLIADGSGVVKLVDWKLQAKNPFNAKITLQGAHIEQLLTEAKVKDVPVQGLIDGTADLRGTFESFTGDAQLNARSITAWNETIDQGSASLRFSPSRVDVTQGTLTAHQSVLRFSGAYTHHGVDWKSGDLNFTSKVSGLDMTSVTNFQKRFPQWKGMLTADATGRGTVTQNGFLLTALDGDATIKDLIYDGKNLGSTQVHAVTTGTNLNLTASGAIRDTILKANGTWKLLDNYSGGGRATLSSASLQTLRDLFAGSAQSPYPFQSALEADATFTLPLTHIDQLNANVNIRKILISPGATQKLKAGAKEQDLVLENAQPIAIHVTPTEAVIDSAQFRAVNTNLSVGGKFQFDKGLDLTIKGGFNLAQLQMFRQDLLASGSASVDTTIRGQLNDPNVNGTLELKKASLYFSDLPTGLDNVNGLLRFDRNRATIQSLTADSGGGKMNLSGFVGFTGPSIMYRLQGNATSVRVRYPEGASTTVNANLNLSGTSQDSLLSGTVTIVRAAFTPRSDLGALIADVTRPGGSASPPDNGLLRGLQLDLRVESAPNLEFQTSLTRGVQADIDLRLRGTAARPVLLGDVAFNDGEISIFGNKYTLNRGDVRFFNPTRIEPVFDIEAQTKARGIDVNVSFSGTPSKLNATYRSDPPLQPSEIIALLAIGRDPNITAGLASSQITQQSTAGGLGNVVGEAVASSVTDRLQKFFGVTRIKIDPQLTGLDNIPQAKVTLEQQVSKDITLTFITNLARTQEQVVRIEWGLSREWSAIAIREENGLFGIDFQYKKRFR